MHVKCISKLILGKSVNSYVGQDPMATKETTKTFVSFILDLKKNIFFLSGFSRFLDFMKDTVYKYNITIRI